MSVSYTFNGHAISAVANKTGLHTDAVRNVLDEYIGHELRSIGVREYTTGVSFTQPGSAFNETDALRAERVQLQDENLGLREDLKAVDGANQSLRVDIDKLNSRIDKVVEIIGDRVGTLVSSIDDVRDEIASVRDSARRAHERLDATEIQTQAGWPTVPTYDYLLKGLDEVRLRAGLGKMEYEHPRAAPFPTGGAHTLEGAIEAVLPVPQRGDRVRLEGARSLAGRRRIKDGWYDVIGHSTSPMFQVATGDSRDRDDLSPWLPWIDMGPCVKEVRHADQR